MFEYSPPELARSEQYARQLLLWLYKVARWLSLISGQLDRKNLQITAQRRRGSKVFLVIWRSIIVLIYWGVVPSLFNQVAYAPKSYASVMVMLQSSTVSVIAVTNFIKQACGETHFIAILNRFLTLYRQILKNTKSSQLFPKKFLTLYAFKLFFTLCGCVHELPTLWKMDHVFGMSRAASAIIGIYMWLGTLYVLDACFLGFLVTAIMYEHCGMYIKHMIESMESIERDEDMLGQRMSRYKRMRLLCDYSDELDACGVIYSGMFELTQSFCKIFQWQILFYIYYNFMTILLMLHECIWQFLNANYMNMAALLMVCIKFANLVLLIMCANYVVKKSELPLRLPLDLVCTDIDQRWDKSVETFLSQQKTKHLSIKVLDFFQLNNQFILLILSAIISYLFILMQFGMTGGFEESEFVKQLLNSNNEMSNNSNSNNNNNNTNHI